MKKTSLKPSVSVNAPSRRDFLRLGGAAVGTLFATAATAATAAPFNLIADAADTAIPSVGHGVGQLSGKIAVLIPRSGPGEAAYAAFTRIFAELHPGVEVLTAPVRPYWSDVTEAARRMIEEQDAKVIVTLMNPTIPAPARDLFASSDAVLIIASAGENILRPEDALPNIFHTSLHLWESNHALGRWAVETYGQRGVISSSLYDSGFDALYAFQMGVEDAGGEILRTHLQLEQSAAASAATASALRDLLAAQRPDFIFHMHSQTPEAEIELAALAESFGIPLLRTSFTAVPSAEGAVVTAFEPGTRPDSIWQAAYTRLGLDTAALTVTALAASQAHAAKTQAICEALRGHPSMHPLRQTLNAPLHLHRSQRGLATVSALPAVDCDCVTDKIAAGGPKTGYITPYLML